MPILRKAFAEFFGSLWKLNASRVALQVAFELSKHFPQTQCLASTGAR
ncbi:hypothetical protein LEP1GSC132_1302 [Leptospira kirschneri str. 200803703]|uniref:Uncharacterized protein n=1 Tax=Leptospira kirschneri str. 200802841 TaxID=1193047 RepID=A0A828Y9Q8_9LEPT|nr:hypothetical protein [Leptospira kirschneri]EKO52543.1 hypothetical protein LEP1GSC131_4324 [Leptospira kirschneri str. 200802841]EMO66521.1 hypothetical protein LEP1GSC132_1302 [Leptospira kirschneri str. 200803703]EMO76534.1 hypothetical protein LEP1GSC127_4398 [Leptospira kirschneri str. 200801925]